MKAWLRTTQRANLEADVMTSDAEIEPRGHSGAENGAITPLLIVNGDDFGVDAESTDAILDCYSTGGITSTSTMMWMADTERASQLADEVGIPVGLHLNLTWPFTDPEVPSAIRDRQGALVAHFRSLARWVFNPALQRRVNRCIDDQVKQFRILYGRDPTHIDGHHHVQVSPNVLAARTIPRGTKVRRGFTVLDREMWLLDRVVRRGLNALLVRRFKCPQYFFSIRTLHPDLGGTGLEWKLALAQRFPVEVMCHPAREDERRILNSDRWRASIAAYPGGSYSDL